MGATLKQIHERPFSMLRAILPDGSVCEHSVCMNSSHAEQEAHFALIESGLQLWMKNPKKKWAHPQDPVTFQFQVRAGCEAEFAEWWQPLSGRSD